MGRLGENGKQWPVAKDGTDSKMIHTTEFKEEKASSIILISKNHRKLRSMVLIIHT